MGTPQFFLYLSHSWQPQHVDANIALWDQLWADCCFLADDNQLEQPPYFISRIEHLIRRADCFVAFVPPSNGELSPYVLFEIALAERAGIPGVVIADHSARLDAVPQAVRCLRLDFSSLKGSQAAWEPVRTWLAGIVAGSKPKEWLANNRAAVLFPGSDASTVRTVQAGLRREGYADVQVIDAAHRDIDVRHLLSGADVLVADVGAPASWDRYGMAHTLAVPTIRCAAPGAPLPALTGGYACGYQEDVIRWSSAGELEAEIARRVHSIRASHVLVDTREEGRDFFERRRRS